MKPYFLHSRAKSGRRFTIAAFIPVEKTDGHTDIKEIRIGTSLCSLKDQFRKQTGRNKSLGRAMSRTKYYKIIPLEELEGPHPVFISKKLKELANEFALNN